MVPKPTVGVRALAGQVPSLGKKTLGAAYPFRPCYKPWEIPSESVYQISIRVCFSYLVILADKQIIQRRDLIIRTGRQAQKKLQLSRRIYVFTAEDPAMTG